MAFPPPKNPNDTTMRTLKVGKVGFEIDEEGQVSTKECGPLGHEEECVRRGEALVAPVGVLEKIEVSLAKEPPIDPLS